jgi:hypothetical protein
MAKLSDLVLRTSEVTGVPVATVREISRRLREGGLIGTGKGGRYGGADMTPSDAASLLTALLIVRASSVSMTDIVPLTKTHLRGLTGYTARGHRMVLGRWDGQLALPELCGLNPGHTFEDALTALVVAFSNRSFERSMVKWDGVDLWIKVASPRPVTGRTAEPEAIIQIDTGAFGLFNLFYILRRRAKLSEVVTPEKWSDIPEDRKFDLYVGAQFSDVTLKAIGLLLRTSEAKHV